QVPGTCRGCRRTGAQGGGCRDCGACDAVGPSRFRHRSRRRALQGPTPAPRPRGWAGGGEVRWLRALLALWLWAAMAPFLLIGWLVGIAWIGLAAGFRLGGLAVAAAADDGRYAWTVRLVPDSPTTPDPGHEQVSDLSQE